MAEVLRSRGMDPGDGLKPGGRDGDRRLGDPQLPRPEETASGLTLRT
jgi:hypothetical protein